MSGEPKFGFIVEYVKDIEKARRFYEDVLGLVVRREHPVFVQFENFAIAADEPMSGKPDRELYWLVDDADKAFKSISDKAEICLPLQQAPYGKVFGVKNLEGSPCYMLEFSENRPSKEVE